MTAQKVTKIVLKARNFIGENSPAILSGIAIVGVVGTVVAAVKATPRAHEICEGVRNEAEQAGDEPKTIDYVAAAWKCYVPTALIATGTVACIVGSNIVSLKKQAAMAALYSTSQLALDEYKEKVKDVIGPNKAGKVDEEVAQAALERNPLDRNMIIDTGYGKTLCYDKLSGRYFLHDIDRIRKAENEFNRMLILNDCMCLNEFYELLGLDSIGLGEECGWTTVKMLDLHFESRLASDGTPCLVIDFSNGPSTDYRFR